MVTAISAFVCRENKGSEHEIGWKAIQEASRKSDVLYVFAATDGNPELEQQIKNSGMSNIKLHLLDIPVFLNRCLKSLPFIGFQIAAYLWELRLFTFMIKRFKFNQFDLAIRSSYGTYRYPSFLWVFSKKFVMDPISGGERFPLKFLGIFSTKGKIAELFRMFMQVFPLIDPLILLTLYKANELYPVSEDSKTILPKYAQKKCRIKENFLEINPKDFRIEEAKKSVSIDKNKLKLFYTGRMLEWKGVMFALRALNKIKNEIDYEFTLMGKGTGYNFYKNYAEKNNLNAVFIDPDNVPRKDLSFYFLSHDIFVFPTLHGAGGFAPVEAKLHEMTLLTLDNSGLERHFDKNDILINTNSLNVEGVVDSIAKELLQFFNTNKKKTEPNLKSVVA